MSELEQEILDEPRHDVVPLRGPAHRRGLERSFGLIAGILFIGGAFAGIPSSLLIEPAPPAELYLVSVASVAFGIAAISIPWDRISPLWTHVAMIGAIIQVGFTVALAGDVFVFYFVFIAIFAAYAFSDRNQVAAYLGLIGIALLLPIVLIPDSTRATAAQALAAVPAIALVAVMVAFLRERLEANRATTRRFAREALALSERIGRQPQVTPLPVTEIGTSHSGFSHPVWRRFGIGCSAGLAVIVAAGTMTAAGVAVPKPIEESFASVGIDPPRDAEEPEGRAPERRTQQVQRKAPAAAAVAHKPGPAKRGGHGDRHDKGGNSKPAAQKNQIASAGSPASSSGAAAQTPHDAREPGRAWSRTAGHSPPTRHSHSRRASAPTTPETPATPVRTRRRRCRTSAVSSAPWSTVSSAAGTARPEPEPPALSSAGPP